MGERYRIGDLTVDTNTGSVVRGNKTLSLSPITFRLLTALARRAPNFVSRQELLETVWPDEFVNDEALSQRVRVLREALGDLSVNPQYVVALRGWGYRLVAPVERIEARAASAGAIRSLAVLPLSNITGDPQLEYFADGMTESLISALAKIGALTVISRTSAMTYKNTGKKAPQIARELGVDAIVEGTVLVANEHIRVSAQLVYAATDEHLWAEIYDRDLGDVFALHSELAQGIAREIHAVVTPEEAERLERKNCVTPAVLEAYLKGRYFLGKFTPADGDRAISCFEQAIAGDPLFADAHAALAASYMVRGIPTGNNYSVRTQRQFLVMAKTAAERALSLNPKLAEAHGAMAMVLLFHDWNWQGSRQALDRALHLEPNSALIRLYRAALAATELDSEKAREELRCAIELDPVNLAYISVAEEILYWIRDYSQAMASASRALDLFPAFPRAHYILARVHEAQGKIEEMISEYEKAGLFTSSGAAAARREFQKGGDAGYYRWALAMQLGAMGDRPVDGTNTEPRESEQSFFRARNYARLGNVDNAIKCLEQSYKERDGRMVLLKTWEWFDSLRPDPRFQNLIRRIGIP
jgi:TolB-like protein/tetratricopeptide (TPR) repeat protein